MYAGYSIVNLSITKFTECGRRVVVIVSTERATYADSGTIILYAVHFSGTLRQATMGTISPPKMLPSSSTPTVQMAMMDPHSR